MFYRVLMELSLERGTDTPATKRVWPVEILGAVLALFIAIVVVSHLSDSDRSVLLYSDGDSLLTVLVAHSISVGQPQDWALSSVLFLPEIAVYWLLSLLNQPVMVTLAINAVVNFLALYASIRYVAGNDRSSSAAVTGSLLAFSTFSALALLESSSDRNSLELASIMATTTYYSATVVGVVLTIGVMRRIADRPRHRVLSRIALLTAMSALSTLTNPIYLAWAAVPLSVLIIVLASAKRLDRRAAYQVLSGLLGGAILGFVGRLPLTDMIANTGVGYVSPSEWRYSADYYSALLVARVESLEGVVALIVVIVLVSIAMGCTVIALRRRSAGATLLASASWFGPLTMLVGALVLGTHASRYLQPVLFMPILALVLIPSLLPKHVTSLSRNTVALVGGIVAVGLAAAALTSTPRLIENVTSQESDPSLKCVTDWVNSSERVGGGQFWTIRAPKAYIEDPRQLVQVDEYLNPYHWLVNRADDQRGGVSFLVTDGQSFAFDLPVETFDPQAKVISCGNYTITDFGERELELGQPHS